MPLLGTNFIETPEISGMRAIVHAVLFLTFFYLGFSRKWKRHSITSYDQDNEKIQEVVTWMRATSTTGFIPGFAETKVPLPPLEVSKITVPFFRRLRKNA